MSHYIRSQIRIRDEDALVKALLELGYKPDVYEKPVNLVGYHGDMRPEKAHVVVRRSQISSASNDVGFKKLGDGCFEAVVSEYDERQLGKDWLGKVTMLAGVHTALNQARLRGEIATRRVDPETGLQQVVILK